MRRYFGVLFCVMAVMLVLPSFSTYAGEFRPHQLTLDEKMSDFNQLINQIKNQYGPLYYKKQVINVDVDSLAAGYVPLISGARTNGEFYSLIVKFVAEFQDGHFGASIPTTLEATLPFGVALVEGHALVEYVVDKNFPKDIPTIERGMELVSFNGRPVLDTILELMPYISNGNPKTVKEVAAYVLTIRPGYKFPVPTGSVNLVFRTQSGEERNIKLDWNITGQRYDETVVGGPNQMSLASKSMIVRNGYETAFDPTNLSSFDLLGGDSQDMENGYRCSGKTRIEIPKDAIILMEDPFVTYYHPTLFGNVGYLRIPHYYPDDENHDGNRDYDQWFEYYRWALTKLEQNTVGLIIDQDHNCGGNVSYLEEIVSLFMPKPFEPLQFQFRASKGELIRWQQKLNSFERPYYKQYEDLEYVVDKIKNAMSKDDWLTEKTSFRGLEKVAPRGVYTKPVIVLTDYLSGSGGDAFPAMMQGLGRAKLLGSQTMGLGGHVVDMEPLFYSQIITSMTQSMFFHPNGEAIENNGPKPDIPYEITTNDFLNGYKDYQKFYLEELRKMVEGSK